MSQIKFYILAILMVNYCGIVAQNTIDDDPETVSNKIRYYIAQAQSDLDNGNYFSAQKKLEEALVSAKQIEDQRNIGLIYSKIGKLHYLLEENNQALIALTNAVDYQRQTKDYANNADTYKTFGTVYMAKGDYNQALEYFKSAKTLFEQENLNSLVAEVLLYEGKAFNYLKNYNEAKKSLEAALSISKQNRLNEIEANALITLAKAQLLLENKNEALSLANQGLALAKNYNFYNVLTEGYEITSAIHESLGNHKISNEYLKKYIALSDSLLEVKKEKFAPARRLQYIIDNQDEIQKQNLADLEEQKEANSLNKLTTILSIALITILSLLTLSLYKNNNIRLKTNNMLHKKNSELIVAKEKAELASKTKANFLSTVTHELRTPLYAVTGITNMLLDEDPKPEQVQHLKSLKFSGEYLLTFINDILQINKIEANKVDLDPQIFNLKEKIKNVIAALNNSALDNNIQLHFDYDKELPEVYFADQL